MSDGDSWLNKVINNLCENTKLIRIDSQTIINPEEIVALKAVGNFKGDHSEGAIDVIFWLKNGTSLEISGLSKERLENLCNAYLDWSKKDNEINRADFIRRTGVKDLNK